MKDKLHSICLKIKKGAKKFYSCKHWKLLFHNYIKVFFEQIISVLTNSIQQNFIACLQIAVNWVNCADYDGRKCMQFCVFVNDDSDYRQSNAFSKPIHLPSITYASIHPEKHKYRIVIENN